MNYLQDTINILQKNVDFQEPKFQETIVYSFICFLGWVILPHLQLKYKLISKLFGNNERIALDFVTYFLIYVGTIRNQHFNEAISNNIKIEYGAFEIPIMIWSVLSMIWGLILIAGSFYRLGMVNMYFGDHFGFRMKHRITEFPYNLYDNVQYVGTSFFFSGYSLFYHSPAGIVLTFIVYILYKVLNIFESRNLKEIYGETDQSSCKKKSS